MTAVFSRVFTLEVDGRPTLAFEASGTIIERAERETPSACEVQILVGCDNFPTVEP
jgi:hypothetical protein